MRIGIGVVLLVLGAILYAADVDLPHVNDDALGLILQLAGLVVIVMAVITKVDRPEVGTSIGLLLIAAGAILAVAVRVELPHAAAYVLGSAFVSAGVLTLIATVGVIIGRRRLASGRRTVNVRLVEPPESDEGGPILRPDLAVISDKDAAKAARFRSHPHGAYPPPRD
ncbi:hypothetical protein ABN028_33035 [Actinopolymorpha sp. B17G11]|uniref:hypothetical protein n=1 Tax=Actinopolymorpha sp. B17G11 TaxID=3160861 RepID=UPI0032E50804